MDMFDMLLAGKLAKRAASGVAVYKGSAEYTIPEVGEQEMISIDFSEDLPSENYVPIIYNVGAYCMACPVLVDISVSGFTFKVTNVGELDTPGDTATAHWCVILIPESEG